MKVGSSQPFALLAGAIFLAVPPALADPTETALEALLRENPALAESKGLSWVERAVLEVLTPGQYTAFLNGKGAQTILLASGGTLADFIARLLSQGPGGDIHAGGTITANGLKVNNLDCTGFANGGALTTDGAGVISCSDDEGEGSQQWSSNGSHIFNTNSGSVGIGVSNPSEKLSVAGVVHSQSGGFRFPDGSIQSTAATNPPLECKSVVQNYGGTVEVSCPSGYTAVSASCNQGVSVVLHGQSPAPPSGSWVWYLIPNADSATGVHCQQSGSLTSQLHLRCCR